MNKTIIIDAETESKRSKRFNLTKVGVYFDFDLDVESKDKRNKNPL